MFKWGFSSLVGPRISCGANFVRGGTHATIRGSQGPALHVLSWGMEQQCAHIKQPNSSLNYSTSPSHHIISGDLHSISFNQVNNNSNGSLNKLRDCCLFWHCTLSCLLLNHRGRVSSTGVTSSSGASGGRELLLLQLVSQWLG